jgi:hypothetical protein
MDHRFPLTNSEAHPGKPIGPVVFQFPFFNRTIFRDRHEFLDRLVPFLSKLPNSHKFAIEMRNRDWLNAGVRRDRSSAADQSSPSRRTDFVLHDAQDATTLCHSEVRWRSRVRHKRPSGCEATRSGGCAASQGNLLQLLGPLVAFLWARATQPPLTLIGPPCSSLCKSKYERTWRTIPANIAPLCLRGPQDSFMIFGQALVLGTEAVGPNRRLWREQGSRQELRTVVLLNPRVV